MDYVSLVNGKFSDKISIFDRGLSYGDGLFETMVWKYNFKKKYQVEFWRRHLKRLIISSRKLNINLPSNDIIENYKSKILRKAKNFNNNSGVLKIIITRGIGGRGYKYEIGMKATVILILSPMVNQNEKNYLLGVNVNFCKSNLSKNYKLVGMKHLNRLDSVLARSEWRETGVFEGLMTDENGNVIEGTMTNIFLIKNDSLYTPSISSSGIKGILREVVIEKFQKKFKKFIECELNKEDILKAESIFLVNSVIKIMPVRKIGNKSYKIDERVREMILNINEETFLEYN